MVAMPFFGSDPASLSSFADEGSTTAVEQKGLPQDTEQTTESEDTAGGSQAGAETDPQTPEDGGQAGQEAEPQTPEDGGQDVPAADDVQSGDQDQLSAPGDQESSETAAGEDAPKVKKEKSGKKVKEANTRAVATSDNLNDFVTAATINATKDAEGKYVIKPGSTYNIDLTFAETMSLQFPNGADDVMTYTLPEGLTAADGDTGTFVVKVNDGGTVYTISNNTFAVSGNKIEVRFNTSDPNFEILTAAANLSFNIAFEGEFDGSKEEILFDDEVVVDLDIDTSHHVSAAKSGKVDTTNDKINYTIVLTSEGKNENIELEDMMVSEDDSPLLIELSTITVKSNKTREDDNWWHIAAVPGSFDVYIDSMSDGEKVTITYSVAIDPTKIAKGSDGKIVMTGSNRVTVKSEDDPETEVKTIDNTINYTPGIDKTGTTYGSNHDTIQWTVTANPAAKVSVGGYKVKDTIASASRQYIKYSGDGLHVKVQDAQGNVVREDDIAWSALTEKNDYTWTYTIPESDTAPYKYTITYFTKADNEDLHQDVTVRNTATFDGGGSKSGSGKIGPISNDDYLRLTKNATDVDLANGTIKWHVVMEVPKDGLDNAEVVDTYPNTVINGHQIYEPVDEDTIVVSDLLEGESYNVVIGNTTARIVFSKDGEPGLKASPTGKKRYIYVDFKTKIDKDWLEANGLSLKEALHSNTISIQGGTGGKDSVVVQEPAIDKKTEPAGTRTEDGEEMPVYKYEVYLTHVEGEGVVTVMDRYDKDLLKPYEPEDSEDAWYVFGEGLDSSGNDKVQKGGQFEYTETADGMQFSINKEDLPKDDTYNGFYPRYRLVYYLTVKDKDAMDKIIDGAIKDENGTYTITNSAEWEGNTDGGDVDYEYPGLSKELLTSDKDLVKDNEDVWAEFKITANPSAQRVHDGEPIKLTDTSTNLDIDITSIRINGEEEWPGVSFDLNGDTMTYWIPDATKIVITYRARVNFVGEGKLEFSNKVQMLDYDDAIEKTAQKNKSGGGIASVPSINLLKHEAGAISTKLSGAEFVLLDSNKEPIIDKDGNEVTYVTKDDGMVKIRGDMGKYGWALQEGETYYLRETKAPENFDLPNADFCFIISEDGHSAHADNLYHSGDTLSAKNYPITDVDVEKVWSDGNDRHEADTVKVKLQQKIGDEEWSDTIRMEDKGSESGWQDNEEGLTAELNADNEWKYSFKELPLVVPTGDDFDKEDEDVDYRIVETEVNGEDPEEGTVKITRGEGDSKYQYTVSNNVNICELKVTKSWEGTDPNKLTDEQKAKIEFVVTRSDGLEVARFTYADMPDGSKTITELAPDEYTVVETGADKLDINGVKYRETVYSLEGGTATVVKHETPEVEVTNVYVPDTEIFFGAEKLFKNGDLKKNTFNFSVYQVSDTGKETLIAKGSTDRSTLKGSGKESGNIWFEPVKYTLDDLLNDDGTYTDLREFTYVIREDIPASADEGGYDKKTDILYDKSGKDVYVTLRLVDNKLIAIADYDSGKAEFVNTNGFKKRHPEKDKHETKGSSTGDDTNLMVYVMMMIAALLIIITLSVVHRKRRVKAMPHDRSK